MNNKSLAKTLLIKPGQKVRLSEWDPNFTAGFKNKEDDEKQTEINLKRLQELHYLLYAESRRSLLVVLQAIDAGGKDGTIRHVFGPLNSQSCKVTSFKTPSPEELSHDFLWRIHKALPAKGEIGIFNRSHYEDVLIVRVKNLVDKSVWSKRFDQINHFEKILAENNTHIIKFFLHISKEEQLLRFKARLEDPTKHWKINPQDFEERKRWPLYQKAFEDALTKCSTKYAPWYIIPANHKWFRNLAVSQIVMETLEQLNMKFPEPVCDVSKIKIK